MRGLTIGITADRRGAEFSDALRRRGAEVVWGPTLATVPPALDMLIAAETKTMLAEQPSYLVVSTGDGLRAWLAAADQAGLGNDLRALLTSCRVVARGAKAAGALRAVGVTPEYVPPQETTEDLTGWLIAQVRPTQVVAVQLHGGEAPGVLDRLRRRAQSVCTVAPYRWVLPDDTQPARELVYRLIAGEVDVLACTSAPAVRHLLLVAETIGAGDELLTALRTRVAAAAVGPVTARAFEEGGVPVSVMPVRARTGDLLRAIDAWGQQLAEGVGVRPGPLELLPSVRAVRAGSRVVALGQQEFALLAALVRRPGIACRTDHLSVETWGHCPPTDPQALKHHIARIRRKLAPLGESVQTVRGVGYRYVGGAGTS